MDSLLGLASPWLYVVIGVLAAAESAALVGLVIPGEAALLIGGVAASQGRVSLPLVILTAAVAAVVGDSVGYELGRHVGPRVRQTRVGRWVGEERWTRAERFVEHRGGPAVLLGRWVGLLRALVPGVAGMTRMPYQRFLLWNVLGAIAWAPAVVIAGYFAGHSFRQVERWLGRASLIVMVVGLFGIAVWLGARWAIAHRDRVLQLGQRLRQAPTVRRIEPAARSLTSPLVERLHPDRAFIVVIGAAIVVIGGTGWGLAETFEAVVGTDGISRLDRPVAIWFEGHRTSWLTTTMRSVSTVGGGIGAVVATAAVAGAAWLRWRAWRPAMFLSVALAGAIALSQAIKHLTGRTRPVAAGQVFDGFAFPSGHTTVSVVVWGAIASLLTRGRPWKQQVLVWATAVLVGGAVGFSRAYLGAHWLTDVIGGWLLGTAWLTTVILSDLVVRRGRASEARREVPTTSVTPRTGSRSS